jgi:hypothetical protein
MSKYLFNLEKMWFVSFVHVLFNGGWMLVASSTFHGVVFLLWLLKALKLYYGYYIYIHTYNVSVIIILSGI